MLFYPRKQVQDLIQIKQAITRTTIRGMRTDWGSNLIDRVITNNIDEAVPTGRKETLLHSTFPTMSGEDFPASIVDEKRVNRDHTPDIRHT